jgi:deazaflavin-dependent oxidoreductase (nitroreductase family)
LASDFRSRLEGVKDRWTIRLVTIGRRSGLPRPVTVWFVYLDGRLFVRTSKKTNWYRNLKANSSVEVEVGGLKFRAEAEQIFDQALTKRLQEAYRRKYRLADALSNLIMIRGSPIFFELKVKECNPF